MQMTSLSIFLAGLAALPTLGQTFAEITGVVTDPSGAVLVGTMVTITNLETSIAFSDPRALLGAGGEQEETTPALRIPWRPN